MIENKIRFPLSVIQKPILRENEETISVHYDAQSPEDLFPEGIKAVL